jgi:hypothetical protein
MFYSFVAFTSSVKCIILFFKHFYNLVLIKIVTHVYFEFDRQIFNSFERMVAHGEPKTIADAKSFAQKQKYTQEITLA